MATVILHFSRLRCRSVTHGVTCALRPQRQCCIHIAALWGLSNLPLCVARTHSKSVYQICERQVSIFISATMAAIKHRLSLSPATNTSPRKSDDGNSKDLPLAAHAKVNPNVAPGNENASIYFVGTATTILEWEGIRLMTDPNFLHAGDHARAARQPRT